MRWRNGVMLSVDGCIVHVEADQEKKKIALKVSGPENARRAGSRLRAKRVAGGARHQSQDQPAALRPAP